MMTPFPSPTPDPLHAALAREARLREALRPFARESLEWIEETDDDFVPITGEEGGTADATYTVGDLRRASRALAPSPLTDAAAEVLAAACERKALIEQLTELGHPEDSEEYEAMLDKYDYALKTEDEAVDRYRALLREGQEGGEG